MTCPPSEADAPLKLGSVGIGKGSGSHPRAMRLTDDVGQRFNRELPLSAGVVRGRYTIDELWR